MEALRLPPTANKLWRRAGRRLATLMRERGLSVTIGGGTILAARWDEHRQSFDIDFKVKPEEEGQLRIVLNDEEVEEFVKRSGGRLDTEGVEHGGPITITFPDTGVGQYAQRIEVFPSHGIPREGAQIALVNTQQIEVASTTQILGGKLRRVGANVPRDLFDLVTAQKQDPEGLTQAINTLPEHIIEEAAHGWRQNKAAISRSALIQISGVSTKERQDFNNLAERAGEACRNNIYQQVKGRRSINGLTIRYRTREGREKSIEIAQNDIRREIAERGLQMWIEHSPKRGQQLRQAIEEVKALGRNQNTPEPQAHIGPQEIVVQGEGEPTGGSQPAKQAKREPRNGANSL